MVLKNNISHVNLSVRINFAIISCFGTKIHFIVLEFSSLFEISQLIQFD